jgi:hypothetical protein
MAFDYELEYVNRFHGPKRADAATFFLPEEAQLRLLSPIDMLHASMGAFIVAHIPRKTRVGTCQ